MRSTSRNRASQRLGAGRLGAVVLACSAAIALPCALVGSQQPSSAESLPSDAVASPGPAARADATSPPVVPGNAAASIAESAPAAESASAAQPAPAAESASAAAPSAAGPATDSAPAASPVVRPPEPPWVLRPYVVRLEVSFAADPLFSQEQRRRFLDGLHRRLVDDLGRMWTLSSAEAVGAQIRQAATLSRLTADAAVAVWPPTEFDKVYLLVVERHGLEVRCTAREWDGVLQDLGPVQVRSTSEPRLAVELAAGLVRHVFRPLAQITAVSETGLVLQTRAGELAPPDPVATQITPGTLLTPAYRQLDRNKQVKRIQRIPWTLLRAESVDRARVEAQGLSVFPVAAAPSKRRMESLAIMVRPWWPATELTLIPRGQPGNPLAGTRVDIVDRVPTKAEPASDQYVLRTNRQGVIRVPADAAPMVRYALVGSGKQLLARVPFLPGAEERLTLEVIDDAPRLSTEGELALLEADLIELVARRQILILRTEALAKEGQTDEAAGLLRRLRGLPDLKAFRQRVDLVRTAGVEAAKARKDPVGETRVKRLCLALSEIAVTHLDDLKFQEQLRDLQDLAGVQSAAVGGAAAGGSK